MADQKDAFPFVAPFFAFVALLATAQVLEPVWSDARYWFYPAQTVVCGAILWYYRGDYPARSAAGLPTGLMVGFTAWVLWITPALLRLQPPRTLGFDPDRFQSVLYGLNLVFRFARLVVIVPLLEELFWRGFLLRYLVNPAFRQVPFGTFTPASFGIVSGLFMLEHSVADWPAALVTGALYNWVAYRTRNLHACVFAHAVTNLLLGVYVLSTKQWGYW